MVAVRGITPELTQFLFDMLQAGNWVMLPVTEDFVAITTAPESIKGIPDGFPEIVTVNTADEVAVLVHKGVQAWQEYRDNAAGR